VSTNIPLKCRCGALQGSIQNIQPAGNNRAVCYCDDCQAYAHYLGRAKDVLNEHGGTDVFPAAPSRILITNGAENLKCIRLTGKGMIRWYASCCKTPIANCPPIAKIPFAGVVHSILDIAGNRDVLLGPVRAGLYGKFAIGGLPKGASRLGPLPLMLRTLAFMLKGLATGAHQPSPFFDRSGKPTAEPYVLTASERESLRPLFGPIVKVQTSPNI
jgi:hypothetical protein